MKAAALVLTLSLASCGYGDVDVEGNLEPNELQPLTDAVCDPVSNTETSIQWTYYEPTDTDGGDFPNTAGCVINHDGAIFKDTGTFFPPNNYRLTEYHYEYISGGGYWLIYRHYWNCPCGFTYSDSATCGGNVYRCFTR